MSGGQRMFDISTVFTTAVAILLPSLFGLFFAYRRKQEALHQDPYKIRQCPNPDCVRCTRYAEVNESAQRRLPWILWSIKEQYPEKQEATLEQELRSIVHAVRKGPDTARGRKRSLVSPTLGQYPTVLLVPGLVTQPVVTRLHDAACQTLLQGGDCLRQTILKEYLDSQNAGSEGAPQWLENDVNASNSGGGWHVLHILNQGMWNTANMKACPETTRAIQNLSGLLEGCIFGNAFISVLQPGTTIEPHCGPCNVRHRLHFALQIPRGVTNHPTREPVLTVAGTEQTWEIYKCFVFDDSLTHSVDYSEPTRSATEREPSTAARVVLIADLWHPDLTELQRAAIMQLYPSTTR